MILEVCIDSVESALAAQEGGADRVELCADLDHGGTTPSADMIAAVRRRLSIAAVVMIRPRPGDFLYTESEFEAMKEDIRRAKKLGVNGVVLGLLTEAGRIDTERTQILTDLARPLEVTFHRAFDECADIFSGLEELRSLGVNRILTSGGARNVDEGEEVLALLARLSGKSIEVMGGGGITFQNVERIVRTTGIRQVHALTALLADRPDGLPDARMVSSPARFTDPAKVRRMVTVLSALSLQSKHHIPS